MTKPHKIQPTPPNETKVEIEKPHKLSKAEREEAFRLMNENWAKGMKIYLNGLNGKGDKEGAGIENPS